MMNIKAALTRGLALVSLAAWLAVVPFVAAPRGAPPSSRQYATSIRQTVVVQNVGQGSAVVIERGGEYFAWTAAHVVEAENEEGVSLGEPVKKLEVQVIHREGGVSSYPATVIAFSKEVDIALLHIKAPKGTFVGAKFADASPLAPGTPVYHVGNYFGTDFPSSLAVGIVAQNDVKPSFDSWPWPGVLDQISAPIFPGSSGGPVFDASGRVVGLAVGRVNAPVLAVMVPVRAIEQWAKANGYGWAVRGNIAPKLAD